MVVLVKEVSHRNRFRIEQLRARYALSNEYNEILSKKKTIHRKMKKEIMSKTMYSFNCLTFFMIMKDGDV